MTAGSLAGNVIKISSNSQSVTIHAGKPTQDSKNNITNVAKPAVGTNTTVSNNAFNMNRITTNFTIEGYVCDGDDGRTAKQQMKTLDQMFESKQLLRFDWSNGPRTPYSCYMSSLRLQMREGSTEECIVTLGLLEKR